MNVPKPEKKLAVLAALVEGNSVRSTSRMTGVHKMTILKHLVEAGERCGRLMDERMRNLSCPAIEADEVWAYVGKKQKRLTPEEKITRPDLGDQYTFIAFDPATKLVPVFVVGKRDSATTFRFVRELRERIVGRAQLSTDAFRPYIDAVERAFGADVDYAQVTKGFAAENPGPGRYSPPRVTGVEITHIAGVPDPSRTSTSYVERHNLTIRMQLRRFTRLTNAFSKKLENLIAAMALYLAHYNFCRIHGSLRITPAMAAGVTARVWELAEPVA